MNALAVLNLNDFMPAKARDSMQAAATRWGVEYVEITERVANVHYFWQKTFIPLKYSQYQRLAVLDADILIRSDCPSLFDIVPPAWIGCVSDVQHGFPKRWREKYQGRREGLRFGLKPYPTEKEHVNGGMIVYEPTSHAYYLDQWRAAGERAGWDTAPFADEGALSCVLQHFDAPVWWLPWKFNALVRDNSPHTPLGKMNAFIYHFYVQRVAKSEGRLAEIMDAVEWKL